MAISTWNAKDLKVIVKAKAGEGGSGGKSPKNIEIDQDSISDILNGMADDHKPGEEGADKDDTPLGPGEEGEIDKNGQAINREVENGGKKAQGQEAEEGDEKEGRAKPKPGDASAGSSRKNNPQETRVGKPTYTWKQLIKRFVSSHKPKPVETYQKISRKSVTGAHVATQQGAAAIHPGQKPQDDVDAKLAFIIDSSGSMSHIIPTVMADAMAMLRHPLFMKSVVTVLKFSSGNAIWKVVFAQNKAAEVKNVNEMPQKWPLKADKTVFGIHFAGGTEFDAKCVADIKMLFAKRYNVVFFLDDNVFWPVNWPHFLDLIKAAPQLMFIIFDQKSTYETCKKKLGGVNANFTHF